MCQAERMGAAAASLKSTLGWWQCTYMCVQLSISCLVGMGLVYLSIVLSASGRSQSSASASSLRC
jgi:hypothetical protein